MTDTERIDLLEKRLNALINKINNDKFYSDAEVNGVRKATSDITPYTETKTAYYNETEKVFYNVPDGRVSVYFDDYNGAYSVNRIQNRLIVSFDALTAPTDITISIL